MTWIVPGLIVLSALHLFRLLGGSLVGWTVSKKEDVEYCLKFFDTIIFEFVYQ